MSERETVLVLDSGTQDARTIWREHEIKAESTREQFYHLFNKLHAFVMVYSHFVNEIITNGRLLRALQGQ